MDTKRILLQNERVSKLLLQDDNNNSNSNNSNNNNKYNSPKIDTRNSIPTYRFEIAINNTVMRYETP
jgi:hypothetical protein